MLVSLKQMEAVTDWLIKHLGATVSACEAKKHMAAMRAEHGNKLIETEITYA